MTPVDASLYYRIQENHTRDDNTRIVTKVDKLESPPLQKRWIDDLHRLLPSWNRLTLPMVTYDQKTSSSIVAD